jgi:hypothetical protein
MGLQVIPPSSFRIVKEQFNDRLHFDLGKLAFASHNPRRVMQKRVSWSDMPTNASF